jgi:tripartite-type tricarboxylate transporter receptor subunit TctC
LGRQQFLTNKLLVKDVTIDYRTAFAPVNADRALSAGRGGKAGFPAQTFDDFVKHAKANPGKVTCGTPPAGGMGHLALEYLQRLGDFRVIHTPYRGRARRDARPDGRTDRLGVPHDVDDPARAAGEQGARARRVERAARRDVPRCARDRRALPGYDMDDWNGLFAPPERRRRSSRRSTRPSAQALRDPAIVAKMAPTGTVLAPTTTRIRRVARRQRETMERIIRDANITLTS